MKLEVGRITFPPRREFYPLPKGVPMSATAVVPESTKVYKVVKVVRCLLDTHFPIKEFEVPDDYELLFTENWLVLPNARIATSKIVWVKLESKTVQVS